MIKQISLYLEIAISALLIAVMWKWQDDMINHAIPRNLETATGKSIFTQAKLIIKQMLKEAPLQNKTII